MHSSCFGVALTSAESFALSIMGALTALTDHNTIYDDRLIILLHRLHLLHRFAFNAVRKFAHRSEIALGRLLHEGRCNQISEGAPFFVAGNQLC